MDPSPPGRHRKAGQRANAPTGDDGNVERRRTAPLRHRNGMDRDVRPRTAECVEARNARRIRLDGVDATSRTDKPRELAGVQARTGANIDDDIPRLGERAQDTKGHVATNAMPHALEPGAPAWVHLACDADRRADRIYEAHGSLMSRTHRGAHRPPDRPTGSRSVWPSTSHFAAAARR